MSDRRLSAPLCALLLVAGALPAQDIEQQRRAVDSLQAIALAARARITHYDDSVRASQRRTDTIVAAPFRILTQPKYAAVIRAAAPAAADSVLRVAGDATNRLASTHLIVTDVGGEGRQNVVLVNVVQSGHETIGDYAPAQEEAIRNVLARLALATIAGSLDYEFRRWAGGAVSWDSMPTDAWRHVRMRLLSEGRPGSGECFAGDRDACTRMLLTTTDTIASWNYGLRVSLASVAVQAGGPGAFQRLLLHEGSPIERLEATARLPMDSIVARWQERARFARGPSDDMRPGMAIASTFWIILMGACSLRSSRWR